MAKHGSSDKTLKHGSDTDVHKYDADSKTVAADAPAKPAPEAYNPVPPQPPIVAPHHSDEEAAELEAFYESLKPAATAAARDYVLARTPAKWQADMTDLIEADWPMPEPPPETTVLSEARDMPYEPADPEADIHR